MTSPERDDNGILGAVLGTSISDGAKRLPAPDGRTELETVEVDDQHLGLVRITYRPHCYRRHKTTWWGWIAEHAEKAQSLPDAARLA